MSSDPHYEIYSDGGSRGNPGPGASAFVVYKNSEEIYKKSYFFKNTTNNIAEYFAALMAVTWVEKNTKNINTSSIDFYMDSELIVKQLNGIYKIKSDNLRRAYEKIKSILNKLKIKISFIHIPREKNKIADKMVNETMDENL